MLRVKSNSKIITLIAIIAVACLALSTVLALVLSLWGGQPVAEAATQEGDRVTPLDLMSVYSVDWVMGPLATKATSGANAGKYVDNDGNVLLDNDRHETNNAYGIPASQYFNINNYLHITTSGTEKILRGWKNNIKPVSFGSAGTSITPDGFVKENGTVTGNLGIYVTYKNVGGRDAPNPSDNKYMLIMPDDITQIGTGSGALNGKRPTGSESSNTTNSGADYQFTDFAFYVYGGNFVYGAYGDANWSPRERLVGVYFDSTSNLKSINNGLQPDAGTDTHRNNRQGKAAFAGCDNMKFFVLPNNNKFSTIGEYSLAQCSQIRDFNVPSSTTTIGAYALSGCSSMIHLTIPSNVGAVGTGAFNSMAKLSDVENHSSRVTESSFSGSQLLNYYTTNNGSKLYVVGNDENDTGANGIYICKNVGGYTGTLATISNPSAETISYVRGNWYAVALAGKDDTTATVVRRLPKIVETNDARRRNVLYDYLNGDGKKCTNTLDETITKYDIGKNMAKSTWCCNVVLPACVDIIGDGAFYYTHMVYMEMHASTVGKDAFGDNATIDSPGNNQNYYIHKAIAKYGASVFAGETKGRTENTKLTRRFIFENQTLYNTYVSDGAFTTGTVFGSNNDNVTKDLRYQIPIIANVSSADGDVSISTGDIDTRFDYDADYDNRKTVTGADANGNGTYKITYTKRLSGSGFGFNAVKTALGTWVTNTSNDHASPIIEGMSSTVWYTNTNYSVTTTASGMFSQTAASVNIYTKKIAKPANIKDGTYDGVYKGQYTFGSTYTFGVNSYTLGEAAAQTIDFYTALGLSSADYTLNFKDSNGTTKTCNFAFPNGESASATNLRNAGTYTFTISLNTKWGAWSQDYKNAEENNGYFNASITVARKTIDYSSLDKIPQFVNAAGDNVMHGNATPLYNYNDGWYAAQQNGAEPNDTRTVTNAYCYYYEGKPIKIKMLGEVVSADKSSSTLGNSVITFRDGLEYTASGRYTATFQFTVKPVSTDYSSQSNYTYYYGANGDGISDATSGLTMSNQQWNSFRLTKRWYIVVETNMFIVSGSGNASPYAPVTNTNLHYADTLTAQVPALYKGNNANAIDFEILFTPVGARNAVTIAERTTMGSGAASIEYYINSSMPAGEYVLKLYGASVTTDKTYPAISSEYIITVLPKALDEASVKAIHNVMNVNGTDGNAYPLVQVKLEDGSSKTMGEKLHDSIATQEAALNAKLVVLNATNSNYWTLAEQQGYFDTAVSITYNVEGTGNTIYSNAETILSNNLSSANTYTLYYCIAAKNYETVGGADNYQSRANYSFKTTIYTDMKLDDIYAVMMEGVYLQNVTYTGSEVHTLVPTSQYYSYAFNDSDYVNARIGATVTLSLYNPTLARWNMQLSDKYTENLSEEDKATLLSRFTLANDGKSLIITFNILPATNAWSVAPQMPSWSFNGFAQDVNFITAGLLFAGATVTYSLRKEGENTWRPGFTVDGNGNVNDATAILLNKLQPGRYYLRSEISNIYSESDSSVINVNGGIIETINNTPLATITVSKAVNSWTKTPNVMTWTWGSFDATRNTISATAAYPTLKPTYGDNVDNAFVYTNGGAALPVVTFSIKRIVDGAAQSVGLDSFTSYTAVAETLKTLPAGTYSLTTSVGGSDYYTEIAATTMNFVIAQATNGWTVTPSITGWQYNSYANNFVKGEPTFGNASDVVYKVSGNGITEFTLAFNANGSLSEESANKLNALAAGNYSIVTNLAGNTDYTAIVNYPVTFMVSKATSNVWSVHASVIGWTYNQTASTASAGTATFGSDTAKYTLAKQGENEAYTNVTGVVNVNLTALNNALANNLGAGLYRITVTIAETDNYVGETDTLTFRVAKASNSWQTAPSMSKYEWIFDQASATVTNGIVANTDGGKVTVKAEFYAAEQKNGAWTVGSKLDNSAVMPTQKGYYALVVTANGTDNFNELKEELFFNITMFANSWDKNPENSLTWVWGATSAMANSVLVKATAVKHNDVTYNIRGVNGTSYELNNVSQDEIIDKLAALNVGSYVVTVTSAADADSNFSSVTSSCDITVNNATLVWTKDPANAAWSWGDRAAETDKIVEPQVNDIKGNAVTLTYALTYGDVTVSGISTYAQLVAALKNADYDANRACVVTVTAELANYSTTSKSFTITVEQSANEFKNDAEYTKSLRTVYETEITATDIVLAVAVHGNVEYKRGDKTFTTVDAIVEDINGLGVGEYTYTITVDEAKGRYDGITATFTVTVLGKESAWDNEKDIQSNYTFTYDSDTIHTALGSVVIPTKNDENLKEGDKVSYSLSYKPFYPANSQAATYDYASKQALADALAEQGTHHAGIYTITAKYEPFDKGYSTLNRVITVTVNRIAVELDKYSVYNNKDYENDFEAITIPEPVLKIRNTDTVITTRTINYTITNAAGETFDMVGYSSLVARLKALNVGQYTIKFYVAEDVDYTGVASESEQLTFRLRINPALNSWQGTPSFDDITVSRGQDFEIEVPKAERGTTRILYNNNEIVVGENQTLGSYLKSLDIKAGTHRIDFIVDASPEGNYNGVSASVIITVTKNANSFTTALANVSWTYGTPQNIAKPTATANSDKISYTIIGTKLNGTAYALNTFTSFTLFSNEVNALDAGTYTIAATIAETDDHVGAACSATVVVSQFVTNWIGTVDSVYTWVYNAKTNTEIPKIAINTDELDVEFTINNTVITDGKYNAWLQSQHIGTYILKATVNGGLNYSSLTMQITVVINAADNGWAQSTTDVVTVPADLTFVHGALRNAEPKTIKYQAVQNPNGLRITIDGKVVAVDNLDGEIAALGVGTHTLIATVPESGDYKALNATVTITVTKQTDKLIGDFAIKGWEWCNGANTVDFTLPAPTYAEAVTVTISNSGDSTFNTISLTVRYRKVTLGDGSTQMVIDGDSYLESLSSRLQKLNVGNYKFTVEIADTDNYSGDTKTLDFKVSKADNVWGSRPSIIGWSYDQSQAYPQATPTFGNKNDVEFSYADFDESILGVGVTASYDNLNAAVAQEKLKKLSWSQKVPTDKGAYFLKAYLVGTDNYSELYGFIRFEIGAANNGWIDLPNVVEWSWNNFNKEVNLFGGAAKIGDPSFTIRKYNSETREYDAALSAIDFTSPITAAQLEILNNGFYREANGSSRYVSEDLAALLNTLKPATYKLFASVSGIENYNPLENGDDCTVMFTVSRAANGWTAPHGVVSYTYKALPENAFTAAAATHGTVSYRLTGGNIKEADALWITEAQLKQQLANLHAGTYFLDARVDAKQTDPFFGVNERQIRFVVAQANNEWTNNTGRDSQITAIYTDLHDADNAQTTFEALFARFGVKYNDNGKAVVKYDILDANYYVCSYTVSGETKQMSGLAYDELLGNLQRLSIGQYYIRATVGASDNYLGLSLIDTALTIESRANEFWANNSERFTAQWKQEKNADGELVNASVLNKFTFGAKYGTVKFIYAGETYYAENLANLVKGFNAGSYNITAVVDETNDYAGLSTVVMLVVGAGTNSWQNDWEIEQSLKVSNNVKLKWTWGSEVTWVNAIPVYGTTVYVEIRKENATSASHYITIDYSQTTSTILGNINTALSGLDVGNYTLTVTAPASKDGNWQELTNDVELVVDKATTVWTTDTFVSGAIKTGDTYKWTYGAANVSLSATASNKAVVTYSIDGTAINTLPTEAGTYVVKCAVADTDNYDGISKDITVTIAKASLSTFSDGPSANGWTWNAFNRFNHRFVAVPNSLGAVTFSVLDEQGYVVKVSGNIFDDEGNIVETVTNKELKGITLENSDGRMVVSAAWANYLNLLTAGSYTLKVDVAETANYVAFTNERVSFSISEATNTWTTTPSVAPWSLNQFKEEENTPVGAARYGYVDITITADVNGEVFYHKYFDEAKGEYVIVNNLNAAPIGWYTMVATVSKVDGKYNNGEGEDLTGSMRFQIFVKGSTEIKNYWVETPTIEGWIANFDGAYNMPVAEPARGRVYFEFFKAIKNADGSYSRGAKITKDDYVVTVTNENEQYDREWYVPVEPGFYYMDAHAIVSGMDDPLHTIGRTPFEIYYRTNSFTEEPRIETLLYLGDKANWADPTLAVLEANSEITLHYYDKEGNDLGSTIPTVAGTYYLVATVEAPFCRTLESKRVEFKVELSQNSWTSAPSIKDWSEEFDSNNPAGAALVGSENIVYEWAYADKPDELFNFNEKKPTDEGSYIMYATLKMDGYADLVSEPYSFVIEPAYDADLLLVDIILGLFASALAVAVTIFAIRRYKEN